MSHVGFQQPSLAARWFCLLVLVMGVEATSAIEICRMCAAPFGRDSGPADLTGLSLQELYNLDVVQPNILGGHTHPAGQAMVGYSYMHMSMSGLYQGSRKISPETVFAQGFGTVHTSMDMDMHMFDFMYAPTERLTLMAMLPFKSMSMEHLRSNGKTFSQSAEGFGDLELMGMVTLLGDIRKGGHRLVLNLGMSLPTGSINVQDRVEGDQAKPLVLLEYFMQFGSGTYDLLPGLTYLGDSGAWSWGVQTIETVRLGRNDQGYRFGDEYHMAAWASYAMSDWFAPSLRLDGRWWEDVIGRDTRLAANPTPEGRADLRGGRRLDLLLGLNFYVPRGIFRGTRFMIEGGVPVYQHLDGPQLGTAWTFITGITHAF